MVGGVVAGVARGPEYTLVNVEDRTPGRRAECALCVEERRKDTGEPIEIRPGHTIWWQGGTAFWSDEPGVAKDIPLPRVGYSH